MDDLCLQSLAFPDMETRGDIDPRTAQTCEWISQHAEYLEWSKTGGLLWIKGRPGTGKSTLMEYLRKADLTNPANIGAGGTLLLSFFFHRRGHELQKTPLGLFRSLLHQILRRHQEILSNFVTDTRFEVPYQTEGEPGKDRKWDWTAPELQGFLFDCVLRATKVRRLRLYIDALDESGEKAARALMEYLGHLHTKAANGLEICISCRPWPDVIHGWNYCIDVVEENAHDIKQLLRERLRRWSASSAEIENEIASRASGVFQWAVIVVERVLSLRKADTATILTYIRDAPGNLDDMYHEMINKLTGADRKAASRLFRWMTFVKRPLSLTEIRYAVAVEANSELHSFEDCHSSAHWCNNDEQMREKLKRLSSGLVRIAVSDGIATVQFDHESVQDYMMARGIMCLQNPQSIDSSASIRMVSESIFSLVCFRYLACPDITQVWREVSIVTFPFAKYATAYCWVHTSHAESGGDFVELILNITQWPDMEIAYTRYMPGPDVSKGVFTLPKGALAIQHFAAYHGISSIIRHLISKISEDSRIVRPTRKRADIIDARDVQGRTPLWHAASRGRVTVLKLLLNSRRVDINAKDEDGVSPLWLAARRGSYDSVMLLIKSENIEMEAKDCLGRTPFAIAADEGHGKIVQLLLETGKVDVESRDNGGRTPFSLAVYEGYKSIVKLLLETGKVDVESRDHSGSTPFSQAVDKGYKSIVKLLLETGKLDIEVRDKNGQTPLIVAAVRGHEGLFQLLLEQNADVEAKDVYGGTALFNAAYHDNEGIVQLLLKHVEGNAELIKKLVNARDHHGWTPLMAAATINSPEIVRQLLETDNVDINATNSTVYRETALWLAAYRGHEQVVRALLRTGKADINTRCMYERDRWLTPLEVAEMEGHHGIADILREYEKEQGSNKS